MKIVHLEDFIHPDTGYQVNLLGRLQVRQGHDVEVVTGELEKIPSELTAFFGRDNVEARDTRFERETGVKIHRIPLFGFYSGRAIFKPIKLIRKILSLKPSVLFVHGEDTERDEGRVERRAHRRIHTKERGHVELDEDAVPGHVVERETLLDCGDERQHRGV